ncbi:non-specific serine/threonine protein kinase [Malassezia equina]|uniref:non-specific serine/threonine protein kinase n=1 Tax=Malassezia equina TaxID=1381935 RepID=A0AAF0EBL3_9BASI|nr:non-specific serine/threonine protein kinase [Malassezia equina]
MAAPRAQGVPDALRPFQGQRPLQPGMRVRIGAYLATVQRFLSQGGFACVYLVQTETPVRLPGRPGPGETQLVLKHMCVWDKEALSTVRAEVDHHRALQGHEAIVHFVEASAATLAGGGWEIFILMEYCCGGGLIDFLNSRLQHRLSEIEVLRIFRDVCEGVQVMHHHDPVLVHRDLKIENVLLATREPLRFKLCDFGSCMPILSTQPARSAEAMRRLELDLQQHTTMQYRAPEMIDLSRHVPITEKADLWALGVLLYKLCYYTTPFEAPGAGAPAIMMARYDVPTTPVYSCDMQALIRSLLQVRPDDRPTIDTLLRDVRRMWNALTSSHPVENTCRRPARPDSLILEVDEAAMRFPSVGELAAHIDPPPAHAKAEPTPPPTPPTAPMPSATRSVRAMVAAMNAASSAQSPRRERPLSVSIAMEPNLSSPGVPAHTLVDVDVSSSSDDEPEDAGATFRVRVRPSILHHPVEATSSQVPPPADALHELLVHAEAEADTMNEPVHAPKAEELDSLAEHERALQGLLSGAPPTSPSSRRLAADSERNRAPCSSSVPTAPPTQKAVPKGRKPTVRPKPAALALAPNVSRSSVRMPAIPVPLGAQSELPAHRSSATPPDASSVSEVPTGDLLAMDELPAARRAPAWDEPSPPPGKTYVDASTSPRRPSSTEQAAPTHGIDSATTTVAPTPRHAVPLSRSTSAQSAAHVHARGVRLTKRETQGHSDEVRAAPVPFSSAGQRPDEASAPSEGVSGLIQKWQSQVR